MKYTVKEKLKIVKEHKVEILPLYELANKYDYHISNINYLLDYYNVYTMTGSWFIKEKISLASIEI